MTADIVKLPAKKKKVSTTPLNALQVKNHKTGIIADASPYRGLRLQANKGGTKTWFYRYRSHDGKLKQIKLGVYPQMELAEARQVFLVQKKLRDEGLDPRYMAEKSRQDKIRSQRLDEARAYTLGDMVEDYLVEKIEKQRKSKGAREVRRLMENDLGVMADLPVVDARPSDLHEHILRISERAPDVARNFRRELSAAWRYATNIGRTDVPVMINRDTGGKLGQGKRTRSLSTDELKKLVPWLGNYSETVSDILTLTLYTGLRSGEACQIRGEWLSEENGETWLTIPAQYMKKPQNGDHRVPLVGKALAISDRRGKSGLWFPSRTGGAVKQKVVGIDVYAHSGRSKAKAYKGYSVCPVKEPWAPNDLRKTARTKLAELGCPFEVAESILHHRVAGVAGLYNRHQYDKEKRAWLLRYAEYLNQFY